MATLALDDRPVQMNVRMNRQLKDAGDAVLERLGISASQAVRDLWEYLVVNEQMPASVGVARGRGYRLQTDGAPAVKTGPEIVQAFYDGCGLSRPDLDSMPSYDELFAQAMEEEHPEWFGL